jgi:hypothetical protein
MLSQVYLKLPVAERVAGGLGMMFNSQQRMRLYFRHFQNGERYQLSRSRPPKDWQGDQAPAETGNDVFTNPKTSIQIDPSSSQQVVR